MEEKNNSNKTTTKSRWGVKRNMFIYKRTTQHWSCEAALCSLAGQSFRNRLNPPGWPMFHSSCTRFPWSTKTHLWAFIKGKTDTKHLQCSHKKRRLRNNFVVISHGYFQ